jgi:hypothetical protein
MKTKNVKMDFVSSSVLDDKPREKRINFILNKVKDGTILVTDGVLHADEEMELIRETMRRVDDGFPGIEVASLKRQMKGAQKFLENISDQRDRLQSLISGLTGNAPEKTSMRTGLTLIGPAKLIKKVKKNPDSFSVSTEL